MSQEPVTVTYSLEEILKQINERLHKIEIDLTEVKTILNTEIPTLKEDIKELKSSSKAQIWTLIGILVTAVAGFLVAVGRFVISGNP